MHSSEMLEKIQEYIFDIIVFTDDLPNIDFMMDIKSKINSSNRDLMNIITEQRSSNSHGYVNQVYVECEPIIIRISFYLMLLTRINLKSNKEIYRLINVADEINKTLDYYKEAKSVF